MKPVIFEEHSSVLPEWWRRQESGDLPEAEQHLLFAHRLAPAWLDILVTLSDIQRRLGKAQAARETTEKFQQQQSALAALATRLR